LRDSDNLPAVVRAGHDLGNLLRDVGQYEAALAVFERAIEAGAELSSQGDPLAAVWGQIAARSGRAMTFASMGRIDDAIADQRAVHELAVREGNVLAQAHTGFHLADHLREKGDLQAAELQAMRTLELCTELGLTSRAIKCRLLLGDLAERSGRASVALEHYEHAERLSRRNGVEIWLDAVERMVALLRAQGQTERLASLLAEAETRARQNGDPAFGKRVSSLVATS
jgi:tetratricopeptide (TPR) repeat protein